MNTDNTQPGPVRDILGNVVILPIKASPMTTTPTPSETPKPEGPKVTIERSCFDCRHCISESYQCQSDSGKDVYCGAMDKKRIGDTTWKTPDWCPFLPEDPASRIADLTKRLETAQQCCGFFASVIKCGEPWTKACEDALSAALTTKEQA
jgi:hypothetical protein